MNVAEQIVEQLVDAGVHHIYGIVGDSLNPIVDAVRKTGGSKKGGIDWIHVRHEEAAAFAASAEAQLTGKLAVCAGSCGPGNLHLINGLYDANRTGAPVLAIASHIPSVQIGSTYFQETHPDRIFEECSVYNELISSAAQSPRTVNSAIRHAVGLGGVAVITLPGDITDLKAVEHVPTYAPARPATLAPNATDIEEAAALLNKADKVAIFAGAGVEGAHDEVIALADALKAPIGHSLRGKHFIQYDNPFDVGMTGLLGYGAAAEGMNEVEGWDPTHQHVALSSMDPATGEILAEYAGADYEKRQQNAVTQDIAMAGSAFKPFALLANARLGGTVYDTYSGKSPQYFRGMGTPVSNDGGYSFGNVTLVKATAYSMNTVFVGLNDDVEPENTLKAAIDAGIPEDTVGLNDELLNVLGPSSPHNIDLTTAYSTIANGGERVTAHIVKKVEDSNNKLLYSGDVAPKRVFDVEEVSSIMPALEAVTKGEGTAANVDSAIARLTTAGKTGTSSEQLSAQFVGFVPGMVTAVSMYQSDDEGNSVPLDDVGGGGQFHGGDWPVDVWIDYMKPATANLPGDDFPWKVESNRKVHNNAPTPAPKPTVAFTSRVTYMRRAR